MATHHDSETVAHYERLLAPVYVWMIGGLDEAISTNGALFDRHGIRSSKKDWGSARALDVGAGPGPQSLALAERGYQVTAIDPSATLIAELAAQARRRNLDIEAIRDAAPLGDRHPGPFDVVTCMTDTLVSLPDRNTARELIADAARRLRPAGRLVLSWRDLSDLPVGDARFLPVRSDADRISTCFLESVDDEHVRVHDLLHERDGESFVQRISSYLKLRLATDVVDRWLADAGLSVQVRDVQRGMHIRVARRRA
jgi:SAM-dependent methyltransferase